MYTFELITGRILNDGVQIIPAYDPADPAVLEYEAWVDEGNAPVRTADPQEFQVYIAAIVQNHLDKAAQARGYDGVLSAVSYKNSSVPRFASDATAFLDWRDAVWGYCYTVLAQVQAGLVQIPTAEEMLAGLPTLELTL